VSVRTMARVWESSKHSGANLLLLLPIADFTDDNGRAYPSISTLASKCRTKPRYTMKLLDSLAESGELQVLKGQGPMGRGGRTNLYRIMFESISSKCGAVVDGNALVTSGAPVNQGALVNPGAGSGEPGFREVVNQGAPKPSRNHQEPKKARAPRSAAADCGLRLPLDWTLPTEWKAWAEAARPDIDVSATADNFADYWPALTGAKGRKVDWLATWRTWVRNQRPSANAGSASRSRTSPMHADVQFI